MNLDLLKKNIGIRVQLEPPAIRLDKIGRELPGRNTDWIVQNVTDTEVRIDTAEMLGLTTPLGKDHIHHFTSNPSRSVAGGLQYGFLSLHVQLFIQNDRITYRPCSRPGERVAPLPAPIEKRWVQLGYPVKSGIQQKLEASGYRASWCRESRLADLELEGWEVVVVNDPHGMLTSFHLRDISENQIYVKRRETDLQAFARHPHWKTQTGLVACDASADGQALVFRFSDPTSAVAFLMRMQRGQSGIRCTIAPGRVDTVIGYPVEVGSRAFGT